jgi:hypothetical protein
MTLYVKVGKRYFEATPGQILAACVEVLHGVGLRKIANDLTQRVMDHQLLGMLPKEDHAHR